MSERIQATPTEATVYDPNDPRYHSRKLLDQELERALDICHGCRLCFNLCPSFPALFDAVDSHPGEVKELTHAETQEVVDLCYQCKLCYVKCPYTPDDEHEFQLDFPRLLQRADIVKASEDGIGLRERVLGDPDRLARMSRPAAPIVNWINRLPIARSMLEKTLGIHRDKQLPEFHRQSFRDWFGRHSDEFELDGPNGKVALFHTCFIDANAPDIGKDAVRVFAKNRCTTCVPEQNCCGMPALDGGDLDFAKEQAASNVRKLVPWVDQGYKVLAINPTCSYMMRKEYGDLLGTEPARRLAGAVMDLNEFLFTLKREGTFNRDFQSTPGVVRYHIPCHLKAQNIGFRSRDMMKIIPGAKVELVDRCSGHDGTWAMKAEFFETSMEFGQQTFELMKKPGAETFASDCPLAAIQLEQGTGQQRPMHPIQVLARAYEPDGFPTPVPPQEESK